MRKLSTLLMVMLTVNLFATDYSFTIGGKQYKIVKTQKSWTDAAAAAKADGGHLVHIDSKAEQDSIYAAIQAAGISTTYTSVPDGGGVAYIWIGGTDKGTEGKWLWDGDNDGSGTNFYNGQGSWGSGNGAPVGGAYVNWGGTNTGNGSNEPDNYGSGQDGAAIALAPWPAAGMGNIAGEWNDIALSNQLYYIVEYETTKIKDIKTNKIKIRVFQKENSGIFFKATGNIKNISVFSVNGAEIVRINNIDSKEHSVAIKTKGIYFYRTEMIDGAVISGKIMVL